MDRGQGNRKKLARAIQSCIVELVDTMPFSDSELPDILIQDGCITEDECKEIREKANRKDQVRKLILLIKGRSFKVMKKYLLTLNAHCPSAVKSVWNQYEILSQEKTEAWKCPVCELKENVDVKYVIDVLYAKSVIPTNLFSLVCDNSNSIGHQDYLWDSVLTACSGDNLKYLTDMLKAKDHYNHIAESLNYYRRSLLHDSHCLCSSAGTPPIPEKFNSDENESSATQSPFSTPFTSTYEEENTSPKTIYARTNDYINNTPVNEAGTLSDLHSNDSSEITVIAANTGDEDQPVLRLRNVEDKDQSSDIPSYRCEFLCFKFCRRKPDYEEAEQYIINGILHDCCSIVSPSLIVSSRIPTRSSRRVSILYTNSSNATSQIYSSSVVGIQNTTIQEEKSMSHTTAESSE